MSERRLVLLSSSLLGVFAFALYMFRAMAAALVKQSTGHPPDLWPQASWYLLGPWLPASFRIGLCLAVCVALGSVTLSRVAHRSRDALLWLHGGLWMLAVISLPLLLWARDLATFRIYQCMEEVTPEQQRRMHAQEVYEAS